MDHGFGVSPTYGEINWTGLDFSQAQFDTVTSMDKDAWKQEFALHAELFTQLAYHLPKELVATKAQLEQEPGGLSPIQPDRRKATRRWLFSIAGDRFQM